MDHLNEIHFVADPCAASVPCCVRIEGGTGVRVGVAGHDLLKMINRIISRAVSDAKSVSSKSLDGG